VEVIHPASAKHPAQLNMKESTREVRVHGSVIFVQMWGYVKKLELIKKIKISDGCWIFQMMFASIPKQINAALVQLTNNVTVKTGGEN